MNADRRNLLKICVHRRPGLRSVICGSILVHGESLLLRNYKHFNYRKALFIIQGQWATFQITKAVADQTVIIPWPRFPGKKPSAAGSVAAGIAHGYGLT
jgi:hypothetical protein